MVNISAIIINKKDSKERYNIISRYIANNCPRFVKEEFTNSDIPINTHIINLIISNKDLQEEDKYIVQAGFLSLFVN